MAELANTLGLDIRLLIAQLVNFAILLFILYKLAYYPILDFIRERTNKISKGVLDAKKAEEELEKAEIRRAEIIKKANEDADAILRTAQKEAEIKAGQIAENSRIKILEFAKETKKDLEEEKRKLLKGVREEVANLTILATEKLLNEKMDKELNQKLVADRFSDKK